MVRLYFTFLQNIVRSYTFLADHLVGALVQSLEDWYKQVGYCLGRPHAYPLLAAVSVLFSCFPTDCRGPAPGCCSCR